MQNTELNSDAHKPDGTDETEFNLHGLCNGKLDAVVDILWKQLPEADVPNVKLK
jgi:hypothetical protein